MSVETRIADINLSIRGKDFVNNLTSIERKLLKPFIVKDAHNADVTNNIITVNVECIENFNPTKRCKADPELVDLIKSYFCYKDNEDFEIFFNGFVKDVLTPYILEEPSNQEKLKLLLKDNTNGNKIILQKRSFIVYDTHRECYEAFYRQPDNMFEQNRLWPYNLDIFRLLFRMILNSKKDGIILHASSIEQDGNGYVFVGPGNSGKSTAVRMLEPDKILSDDMTVIRRVEKTYKIYPNPWWNGKGEVSINNPESSAVLKAIFFIEKSEKTSMKKLNYKEALSTLIYGDRSFQQAGFFDNQYGVKDFYLFAQELVNNIQAFKLNIRKGMEFKEEFYKLLYIYSKNDILLT